MTVLVLLLAGFFLAATWALCLGFGLSSVVALCVSALLLLGLAAWALRKGMRARRADRQLKDSLARQAASFDKHEAERQQSGVRLLATQFEVALHTLRSSGLGSWRGKALQALPWYLVIGPAGAGKSTQLRGSGLKLAPRAPDRNVRGLPGTLNCDWWHSKEAVVLDTAGRYSSGDDDHDEWLALLGMVHRARPRRPFNGLIVTLSVTDLVEAKEGELTSLAERVRDRVEDVVARLGLVPPIYLTLTKCDLLPGFLETFEQLRPAERDQVFGFTLPLKDASQRAQRIEQHWMRLVQVVERRSLFCLAEKSRMDARQAVYAFPQQVEALLPNVCAFVSAAFPEDTPRDAPIVRGIYLTSGIQAGGALAGAPSERRHEMPVLGPVRDQTDAPAESRSYFVGDLFREVIFREHELALQNTAQQWRMQKTRFAAAFTLSLAALALSLVVVRAYLLNRELIRGTRDELAAVLADADSSRSEAIPSALEPLRERLAMLSDWSDGKRPWAYGAGLYQGAALRAEVEGVYVSTLKSVLIEPAVHTMETNMAQALRASSVARQPPSAHEHARLYEQLRAYLLLTSARQDGEPPLEPLRGWLARWFVANWQGGKRLSAAERTAMTSHIAVYLQLLAVDGKLALPRSASLVSDVRGVLARVPPVKLAVDRVVAGIEPLDMELDLEAMAGAPGLPMTAHGQIPGAFTRRAWEEHVRPMLRALPAELFGDAWVLEAAGHGDGTLDVRRCALQSEYFSRYIEAWRSFLGGLRVEEPTDHRRAVVVLQDLTRGQPAPLERIARAVAHNARLDALDEAPTPVAQQVASSGLLERAKAHAQATQSTSLTSLLSDRDPCQRADYLTNVSVKQALQGFFSFGATFDDPKADQAPHLTGVQVYQEQLVYLRDALRAYLDDPSSSETLLTRVAAARTRVRTLIETQEVGWRPRLDALLWPAVQGVSSSSTSALAGEKSARWCTSVMHPYVRTLRNRYPFASQGHDAALADLAEFYRPQSGVLWSFYETTLARDLPRRGGGFELRSVRGSPAVYTSELARFLERSQRLSSALFPPNAGSPRVDFEVRVRPSPGVAQVSLSVDGQLVDFHNGPDTWVHLTWPGEGDKRGAQLRVKGARIDETLAQEGEWGLFRLLEQGMVDTNDGERFLTVRFRLRTQNDVVLDVRPARVENPFVGAHALLEVFRTDHVASPRAIAVGVKGCPE